MDDVERRVAAWIEIDRENLELYARKAREYGSHDLKMMGQAMSITFDVQPSEAEEAAIAFYVLGKISRILGAYADGRRPGEDSWDDLRIYSTMVLIERKLRDQAQSEE